MSQRGVFLSFQKTHAALTPIFVVSVLDGDTTWAEDVEVAPGVADLALDEIAETWSGREVAACAVVAEVGHDGVLAGSC
jgi:hypothetical protein